MTSIFSPSSPIKPLCCCSYITLRQHRGRGAPRLRFLMRQPGVKALPECGDVKAHTCCLGLMHEFHFAGRRCLPTCRHTVQFGE